MKFRFFVHTLDKNLVELFVDSEHRGLILRDRLQLAFSSFVLRALEHRVPLLVVSFLGLGTYGSIELVDNIASRWENICSGNGVSKVAIE